MNHPTALPRTPRGVLAVAGVAAVTAVVDAAGLLLGWWWVTVVAAAVVVAACRGRRVLLAVLAGALAAWAVLAVWQSGGRLGDVADLVGALALDERGLGWAVLAVTACYVVVLAGAGAWFGAAVRRLLLPGHPAVEIEETTAAPIPAAVGEPVVGDGPGRETERV